MENQSQTNPNIWLRLLAALMDFVCSVILSLILVMPLIGFWAWKLFAADSIVQLTDAYKPLKGMEFLFLVLYFVFRAASLYAIKSTPGFAFFGIKLKSNGKKLSFENLLKWQFLNIIFCFKTIKQYFKKGTTYFEGDERMQITLHESAKQAVAKTVVTAVFIFIVLVLFVATPQIKYSSIKAYQLSLRGKPHVVPERAQQDFTQMQQVKYVLERTQDKAEIKKQAGYAIDITKHVVEKDEENAQAWNFLGNAYVAKGEKGDDELHALEAYAKAAEIEPTNARYLSDFGSAQSRLGNNEEAVITLKKSLSLKEDAQTYFQLGIAYFKLQNINQSNANLKKAKELFLKDNEFKQHDGDISIIDSLVK